MDLAVATAGLGGKRFEAGTVVIDVLGTRDVESTLNVVKARELNAIMRETIQLEIGACNKIMKIAFSN